MEVLLGGNKLVLLPERAIWMPAANALILSDLHLGNVVNGKSNGFTVPDAVYQDDLNRMDALVNKYGGDVYIVGDLVHMHHNEVWPYFCELRRTWTSHVTLIAGNHDAYAMNHALEFGLGVALTHDLLGITLIHNPHAAPDHQVNGSASSNKKLGPQRFRLKDEGPRICGHLHPSHPATRQPCFFLSNSTLVLPAFGRFTSAYRITTGLKGQIFVPSDDEVVHMT